MPKNAGADDLPNEAPYRGRFFLSMLDKHMKIIDAQGYRLFDLLSEPNFDQEAVNGMGLSRSLVDRKNKLLMLCHTGDGRSYI